MTMMTSMKATSSLRGLAAAAVIALVPMAASAATIITSVPMTPQQLGEVTSQPNPLFDVVSGAVLENTEDSVTGLKRSPFDTADPDPNNNAEEGLYTSVGGGAYGIFNFDVVQVAMSMIWGSPDTYNTLTLSLGGNPVETIIPGSTAGAPDAPQLGAWWFTVTDIRFDSVKFESTTNAFEFANFTTTPIPLPAAGWLLLGGLGALGAVARRKRRKAA